MADRISLDPRTAALVGVVSPALDRDAVDRYYLDIDHTLATAEMFEWTFQLPSNWTTTSAPQITFTYRMPTAITGNIDVSVQVESISPGDVINTITTRSFDTANTLLANTVPTAVGNTGQITITLTNHDGSVSGDYFTVRVNFLSSGTAAGNLHWLDGMLSDAA